MEEHGSGRGAHTCGYARGSVVDGWWGEAWRRWKGEWRKMKAEQMERGWGRHRREEQSPWGREGRE